MPGLPKICKGSKAAIREIPSTASLRAHGSAIKFGYGVNVQNSNSAAAKMDGYRFHPPAYLIRFHSAFEQRGLPDSGFSDFQERLRRFVFRQVHFFLYPCPLPAVLL